MENGSRRDEAPHKYLKYLLVGIIAFFILLAAGVTLYCRSVSYVATVGDEKVTKAEYTYILNVTKNIVKLEYGIDNKTFNDDTFWNRKYGNETLLEYTRKEALSYVKSLKVEYIKAKEKGIKLDKEDLTKVDQLLDEDVLKHVIGGSKEADKYCRDAYGVTVDQLREIYRQIRYKDKLKDLVTKDTRVGEEDIKAYYNRNPDRFTDTEYRKDGEEAVWVRYLAVKNFEGDDRTKTLVKGKLDEAWNKAQTLLNRLKNGEDIKALTEKLSDDKTVSGGELIFVKGKMDKAFEGTAFNKLLPGETSGIVETDFGFTVIKLEEKIPADKPVSYRAAREYHEFSLGAGTLLNVRYQMILNGWLKAYEIKINQSVYESTK